MITNKNLFIILLIVFLPLAVLSSCKDDKEEQEQDALNAYIQSNNITVSPTSSGLYYIEVEEGRGIETKKNEYVSVHYTGTLLNGEKFDSSFDRGKPFKFILGAGQVIAGWDEGISYMKKGEKAQLIIPSSLAYGSKGSYSIPPYSTLIFDVEIINVGK